MLFFFLTKTTGEYHSELDGCVCHYLTFLEFACLFLETLGEMNGRLTGLDPSLISIYGVCVTRFCLILSNLLQNYLDVDSKILTVLVFEMYLNQLDQD